MQPDLFLSFKSRQFAKVFCKVIIYGIKIGTNDLPILYESPHIGLDKTRLVIDVPALVTRYSLLVNLMKPNKKELQKLYDQSIVAYIEPPQQPKFDHYIITAWNPMSKKVSEEENIKANEQLLKDIQLLADKEDYGLCYGYHPDDSWREDGFWVSSEAIDDEQIMTLARKYHQIAIYKQTQTSRPVIWVKYLID